MQLQSSEKVTEPLISILETKVIPWWERCSFEHLAVTALTLSAFKRQQVPEMMRTSVKKRVSKKVTLRSVRDYNNTSSFIESWPEDNQSVFRFPALAFVVSGQADFNVADYLIHSPEGHFLLFRNNVPRPTGGQSHLEGKNIDQKECSVLWFFAPPGTNSVVSYICHSYGAEHWFERDTYYHIVHHQAVLRTFTLFLEESQELAPGNKKSTDLIFQAFLHLFLRELNEGRFHLAGSSSGSNEKKNGVSSVEQAKQYIRTHLNEPLTTEYIARKFYMSRNSFIQHFTRETGQTFHEFVTTERMEEAHRLLSEGYWAVTTLCGFIGLRPNQFRAQFKARFGLTPSEFRSQVQIKRQNR